MSLSLKTVMFEQKDDLSPSLLKELITEHGPQIEGQTLRH